MKVMPLAVVRGPPSVGVPQRMDRGRSISARVVRVSLHG
jgi:hypothetical protein